MLSYGKDFADPFEAGSAGSAGSAGLQDRLVHGEARVACPIEDVRRWLARFIKPMNDTDLDLLALWAAHTHLCLETYTSPRLLLDSPVSGAGKTTVLEHFERLCVHPLQMATLSSPALLVRMIDAGMRTLLIDEADRSLSPGKEGIGDLLAVLNSGYKRGGTRPVLVPVKGGGWDAVEMATFAPVAMAGNSPNLPDDTKSRAIRILLMPDIDDSIEESDWEEIDEAARALGDRLARWADSVRDAVRTTRALLPREVRGRARERWSPLKRIADAAGGRFPELIDHLAVLDVRRIEAEKEEGIVQERPTVVLLGHIHEAWHPTETFVATETLILRLCREHPDVWGDLSSFGKSLTPQRLGRMLASGYNIHSARPDTAGPRGYLLVSFSTAFRGFGLAPIQGPAEPAGPADPAELPERLEIEIAQEARGDNRPHGSDVLSLRSWR
jgi:hypothetical protein